MPQVRLRPWHFGKTEKIKLHWICSPRRAADGRWYVKVAFLRENSAVPEFIEYPWGTLSLLRMGRSYVNGYLVENDPGFRAQRLFNYNFQNGTICKSFSLPRRLYDFFGNIDLGKERVWKFWFNRTLHYIPCIELLRSFLTPSKTLSNQILKPNGLDFLVDNEEIKDNVLIISLSADVPRNLVNDETVAHLVWLRHDETARRCWESVYNDLFAKAITASPQQPSSMLATRLPMELSPPIEKSCELHFNGISSKHECLILELIGARKLAFVPFEKVIYTHPSLRTKKFIKGTKQPRRVMAKKSDEDFELDGQNRTAKIDAGQPVVDTLATSLEFTNLPKFEKVAWGESLVSRSEPEQNVAPSSCKSRVQMIRRSNIVSTDEPTYAGEIQPIDFFGIKLVASADATGLKDFQKAVRHILASHCQPQLRSGIFEIPGNKSCCRFANGSKRTCAIVEVTQGDVSPCYILELARAEGMFASTLLFNFLSATSSGGCAGEFISELLEEVSKRDGHWYIEKLEQDATLKVGRLKHVSEQSAWVWSRRILEKLIQFGFSPEER